MERKWHLDRTDSDDHFWTRFLTASSIYNKFGLLKMEHMILNFLNDSMHTIMPTLMYSKIRSYIECCMLHIHDFYCYYGLLHSLCMHQSKEIIANFILFIKRQIVCIKASIAACMRVISSLYYPRFRSLNCRKW